MFKFLWKAVYHQFLRTQLPKSIFHLLWTSPSRISEDFAQKKELFFKGQLKSQISEKRRLFVKDPLFPLIWLFLTHLISKTNQSQKKYIFCPPHKIVACTLFLHFMVKSFEKVQFCVFAKQSSEKIFFQFWKFPEILNCPIFLFKTFHLTMQATQVHPLYFFLCGQVYGL